MMKKCTKTLIMVVMVVFVTTAVIFSSPVKGDQEFKIYAPNIMVPWPVAPEPDYYYPPNGGVEILDSIQNSVEISWHWDEMPPDEVTEIAFVYAKWPGQSSFKLVATTTNCGNCVFVPGTTFGEGSVSWYVEIVGKGGVRTTPIQRFEVRVNQNPGPPPPVGP